MNSRWSFQRKQIVLLLLSDKSFRLLLSFCFVFFQAKSAVGRSQHSTGQMASGWIWGWGDRAEGLEPRAPPQRIPASRGNPQHPPLTGHKSPSREMTVAIMQFQTVKHQPINRCCNFVFIFKHFYFIESFTARTEKQFCPLLDNEDFPCVPVAWPSCPLEWPTSSQAAGGNCPHTIRLAQISSRAHYAE